MAMGMEFHWVIVEVQRTKSLHVCYSQAGTNVFPLVITPTTPCDLLPRFNSKLRQSLIWFSAQGHFAFRLAHGGAWCCGRVRTDRHLYASLLQGCEPLLRDTKFWGRAAPEQVRC